MMQKRVWQRQFCEEFARFAAALGWDRETADHVLWHQENPLAELTWSESGHRDPATLAHIEVAQCEINGTKWEIEEAAKRIGIPNPLSEDGASGLGH